MEALIKQRASAKAALTRIETFLNKNKDTNVDVNEYTIREVGLIKVFERYTSIQDQIENLDEAEEQDRVDIETKYYSLHAAIKTRIQSSFITPTVSQQPPPQQLNTFGQVKLPQLSIPSFSGKYEEWKSFIDLFTALIDNNPQLTNVQKFVYLKSALINEPLNLVNKLQLTNENYGTALNILKERYDNKLVIINTHIKNLLDVPHINKCNASNLREFLTHIKQHLNSLKSLEISVSDWDLLLIYSFSQKLDFNTRKEFELEKSSTALPTLKEFFAFLEKRCVALENLSTPETKRKVSHLASAKTPSRLNCIFCKLANHTIYKCYKFKALSDMQKRQFIQTNKLCFNCFGSKHSVENCTSRGCSVCTKKHHTLLHKDDGKSQNLFLTPQESETESKHTNIAQSNVAHSTKNNLHSEIHNTVRQSTDNAAACSSFSAHGVQILLATANITLVGSNGKRLQARALLDSGSQTSFISQELVKKLNYKPCFKNMHITGISNNSTFSNLMVDIILYSQTESKREFKVSCAILNKITCPLPQVTINTNNLPIPTDLRLADPLFYSPSEIDLLLGSDVYYDIITTGIIKLGKNLPTLQNTHLGWVIAGPISGQICLTSHIALFTHVSDVNDLIPKFWQLEEISSKPFVSPEDKLCEKIFVDTTKHLENGSFQVDLPLRNPNEHLKLGDSYTAASKRFYSLEKRFEKDKTLFVQYKAFIDEYVSLNHGKYIPLELHNSNTENKYFLPHHCVLRESSATTKLRVVFDASMKTTSGLSLNDIMLKGFPVQSELFDILCRFRMFKYVLITDIQKMYRQIRINPSQLFLLNILWRDHPNEPLKCIELQTVTYGTNSAPYLATRCLVELANEQAMNFPLASEAILTQCYVDDILVGSNTFEELVEIREQLTNMLNSAGFKLHKWCSNSEKFLKIFSENKESGEFQIKTGSTPSKVLGLTWDSQRDNFKICLPPTNEFKGLTKRNVLSRIAQIFDPLGFIGPVVVVAKLFMQKVWMQKIDWDEQLPTELLCEWKSFAENISQLSNLTIPRYLFLSSEILELQIHGFSDASLKAYGACIYLRVLYPNETVSCNLICSKSRVAPLKTVSLPRLELCGVVLLSRLIHKILLAFPNKIKSINLWTDSQIALCWLKSHPSRWTTFVANRVSEVQELTSNCQWRHITSAENPADCLSRGLNANVLNGYTLWWHGPQFLINFNLNLDRTNCEISVNKIPEQRQIVLYNCAITNMDVTFSRFSCFTRLQRTMAYCVRFVNNTKLNLIKQYGPLSVDELQASLTVIIKVLQNSCFSNEIVQLKSKKNISNKAVASLNPFIDEEGLLRVGGRLCNADIPFNQKYPILLPAKNHVVRLLLRKEHLRLYHAGAQTVLANFRLRFWPINGLREIKHIIKNCIICHRFKAQVSEQIMGSLPKDRVSKARPFTKVGIDFGGPLFIKSSRLRRSPLTKCYIAVFVCMVTKAVHLELVSSLSTDAFLLTLKRFISRRGNPSVIYSDNATNFVGSYNQLRELHDFFKIKSNIDQIENFLSVNETRWKFIPPKSPHWGGIWEAAIKSTKYHLKRIVGNAQLTFEELSTVLAQIEAILNSRPLCALSNDPSDLNCLTPGHFLIGDALTSYPERDLSDVKDNRLSFWQRCTRIQQNFWKRWSVEYLNRLQNRPKWLKPSKNLEVNDIVLLKEDNSPPLTWPRARIIEIFPGKDNKVRVVKLKTSEGVLMRPISKICPLPQG